MCQETSTSALLVWRLATRASRQADETKISDSGHNASRAAGGREGSTRWNGVVKTLTMRWRLATREGCARRWRRVAPSGMVKSARW